MEEKDIKRLEGAFFVGFEHALIAQMFYLRYSEYDEENKEDLEEDLEDVEEFLAEYKDLYKQIKDKRDARIQELNKKSNFNLPASFGDSFGFIKNEQNGQ